jgi:hypothetical protein
MTIDDRGWVCCGICMREQRDKFKLIAEMFYTSVVKLEIVDHQLFEYAQLKFEDEIKDRKDRK